MTFTPRLRPMRTPSRQAGVVLIIALIVLVAMTLAGIGLMRSVDTTTRVAGNLGYRQSNVLSADIAMSAATQWIRQNSLSNVINNESLGYYPTLGAAIPRDPKGNELYDQFAWEDSARAIAEDPATKISILYVIERDCEDPASAEASSNSCSLTPRPANAKGGSKTGGTPPNQQQVVQYRITARLTGPRNTVTYVQGTIF